LRELIISIIVLTFASIVFAQSGKINVEISGIKIIKGQVAIGLFNKSEGFPELTKAYKGVFVKVTKNTIQYTFSGIPNGDYAIAVFHDSNNNGKLDKNFLGIPVEGYGFSKNVIEIFRPPDFNKAKFKLDDAYTAKIKIRY